MEPGIMSSKFEKVRSFNRFRAAQLHIDMAKTWLRMAATRRRSGLEAEATKAESHAASHTRIAQTLSEMGSYMNDDEAKGLLTPIERDTWRDSELDRFDQPKAIELLRTIAGLRAEVNCLKKYEPDWHDEMDVW